MMILLLLLLLLYYYYYYYYYNLMARATLSHKRTEGRNTSGHFQQPTRRGKPY
jgi:hypothetical protein